MSLHVCDLVDADVVDAYLFDHLADAVTDDARAEARTLAEEAASFGSPPAGAHVLLARLAELDGDTPELARQTGLALRADPTFAPALADQDYLGFLLFEGGLVERFEADCRSLLPVVERTILSSWRGVRHRLVRLEERRGRRGRLADVATGELLDVELRHEEEPWADGADMALLVPADGQLTLVGEPVSVDEEMERVLRTGLAEADPLLIGELCLARCFVTAVEQVRAEQDERLWFALPDADPATFDFSEAGCEHLRRSHPVLAAQADAGDVDAECRLVLDADGHDRQAVLDRLRTLTAFELAARGRPAA